MSTGCHAGIWWNFACFHKAYPDTIRIRPDCPLLQICWYFIFFFRMSAHFAPLSSWSGGRDAGAISQNVTRWTLWRYFIANIIHDMTAFLPLWYFRPFVWFASSVKMLAFHGTSNDLWRIIDISYVLCYADSGVQPIPPYQGGHQTWPSNCRT